VSPWCSDCSGRMTNIASHHRIVHTPQWPVVICAMVMLAVVGAVAARLGWGGPVGSISAIACGVGIVILILLVGLVTRRRAWLIRNRFKLAVLVVSVAGGLAAAELSLRLGEPSGPSPWMIDPEIGWVPRPSVVTYMYGPKGETLHRTVTDENGFRSEPLRPDSRKIAVVGDSITFGIMVSQEAIATSLLATRLGSDYQVINASAGGWGTDQEYLFFRRNVLPQRPEVVIWVLCASNDITNNAEDTCSWRAGLRKPRYTMDDAELILHEIPRDQQPTATLLDPSPRIGSLRLLERFRRAVVNVRTRTAMADGGTKLLQPGETPSPEHVQADQSHFSIFATQPSERFRASVTVTAALLREADQTATEAGARILFVAIDPVAGRTWMPQSDDQAKAHGWDPAELSIEAGRENMLTLAEAAGVDL